MLAQLLAVAVELLERALHVGAADTPPPIMVCAFLRRILNGRNTRRLRQVESSCMYDSSKEVGKSRRRRVKTF